MRGITCDHASLMHAETEYRWVASFVCPGGIVMQRIIFTNNALKPNDVP